MSKTTNPNTEASVSCGFFNSNYDRYYDAAQMSRIFDGIINDGVFATFGDALVVNAESGNIVNVGTGKCWFHHTWTENDAILPVECEISEVLLDRIDAIIVEVNNNEEVRDNFIKFLKGTPSSSPVRPTLEKSISVHQRALCYIYRAAGSTEITQADITNVVGTDETPFVTGLLDVVSLDELLGKWQDELDQFIANQEEEFNEWFNRMREKLTEDVAGSLQTQIDEHKETKASTDAFGHVMLTDSTAVTDATGLALPATEKNSTIEGTLANRISQINSNLNIKTGTFSPYNLGANDLTVHRATYYKIGKLVHISMLVVTNRTITDNVSIQGLPFTPSEDGLINVRIGGINCGATPINSDGKIYLQDHLANDLNYSTVSGKGILISGVYTTNE